MLVIISDLHLSDGTFGSTLSHGAFQMFAGRLADMTRRASWRADGSYRPIDRIDLVLLGDVLDITRSTRWLEHGSRPWHAANETKTVECTSDIVDRILRNNPTSLRILRALASEGAVRIPSGANAPQAGDGTQAVPVRIHYMVGNHDWQLHLRGVAYDMIRQKVSHHLGLANNHTEPFAHDPSESPELQELLRRHRVICRHGDVFDPLNYSEDRDLASLGDALVVDLMLRFVHQVEQQIGDDLPTAVQQGLAVMDKIRPVLMVPVWIEGVLERANATPALRRELKQMWDSLVDELLDLPIVRERDQQSPFEILSGLQSTLKFSKRLAHGWGQKITDWVATLLGGTGDSLWNRAKAEPDFRNRRARHIVYGHTHQFESVPLDASYADAFVLNQLYFNSGTWQRVFKPTVVSPGEHEFIPSESLSYLTFYQGDERSGRSFETWHGTLGMVTASAGTGDAQSAKHQSLADQKLPNAKPAMARPHFPADMAHSNGLHVGAPIVNH